jgi:hypothetical protein
MHNKSPSESWRLAADVPRMAALITLVVFVGHDTAEQLGGLALLVGVVNSVLNPRSPDSR